MNSDNVALDFLNTRKYTKGRLTDLISTPELLLEWLGRAGLQAGTDVEISPPAARLFFDEAHRLRDAIRAAEILLDRGYGRAPIKLDIVQAIATDRVLLEQTARAILLKRQQERAQVIDAQLSES